MIYEEPIKKPVKAKVYCVSEKCCVSKTLKLNKSKILISDDLNLKNCPKCGEPVVYLKRIHKVKNSRWGVK